MAKSELKDLYGKISKPDVNCEYFSDSIDFESIIDHFKDVENQDSPDGIISLGDTVYMVEHFQTSLYGKGNGDKLQQALSARNTRNLGNVVSLFEDSGDWESQLLDNWLSTFSKLLDKHLSHYSEYREHTSAKYPNKPCKFILMIEDNSYSIITNEDLDILDIQEFVDQILSYDKVDGVIVFTTSSRSNSVIAKDRRYLRTDKDSGKLLKLSSCGILMLIKDIVVADLTPEERARHIEAIRHGFCNLNDNMIFEESVQIEKH